MSGGMQIGRSCALACLLAVSYSCFGSDDDLSGQPTPEAIWTTDSMAWISDSTDGLGTDGVAAFDEETAFGAYARIRDFQDGQVEGVQFQPRLTPTPTIRPQPTTPAAAAAEDRPTAGLALSFGLFAPQRGDLTPRQGSVIAPNLGIVFGAEATTRATTDAGSLLRNSPGALGVEAPRRTPIVTDTRVRGTDTGQLVASGSYWVPARIDLDTTLSKIDSRLIEDMIVIKGPYSSLYGPGFDFIDFELLPSPRYESREAHGSTSFDYKANGEQWYGRQALWGGDSDSGFRVGYGHRTGNDYTTGDGVGIPSSYNSRDFDVALGQDLQTGSVEFNYLRLDQTDVEYPGQAFDMDFLVTDAFDVQYAWDQLRYMDQLLLDVWYNRTHFAGDAQQPGKRRQFPIYNAIGFEGVTDVDSMSTGYRLAARWGDETTGQLTAGSDIRYLKQELNEITSSNAWTNTNSPIPRSHSSNPGLFSEFVIQKADRLVLKSGVRVDWVSANIDDDADKLANVGTVERPYADVVGSNDFDRDFGLVSFHMTAEYEVNQCWTYSAAGGYAERAPILTELYAAQPFMFLLQNGLNTVTGDPQLKKERLWQIDLAFRYDNGRVRSGLSGFHAWVDDYVTFEGMGVAGFGGQIAQVDLKYVNTDLATLAGFEYFAEYDINPWLSSFGTLSYVEGRDHSRNGDFATRPATPVAPSVQVAGLRRGFFSGIPASDEEPLPMIRPLESRIGLRLHEPSDSPLWSIELSARITERQDRVATSLLETETPGFTVWDIRSLWQVADGLKLVAGVENFTDRNYREYLDFRPIGAGALTRLSTGRELLRWQRVSVLRPPCRPTCWPIAEKEP